MRKAIRFADLCSGHTCFPARPNNSASSNVFINNRGSHRLNDTWNVHCFEENTELLLKNGEVKKIKDIQIGDICISINDRRNIVDGLIADVFITKYVNNLLELTLENNKKILCTPDHLFLLKSGEYKEAQFLTEEDELEDGIN